MSEALHQATFEAPAVEDVARLFPAYTIHALIACGGMGAVYQATQISLDRTVAIKILPREFSTDAAFREGFESEAKAMAKLNHPNLIGVYDFGEAGGMLYIIMEYVAGKSLFHSANGFSVDQAEAILIVSGVCHGLSHAHGNGVLHRDIKPSNILLDSSANPKIGDFGLARALEREIQEGEQIFGTPGYTAPEVLTPPFTIDQRADIFSVGVMLHELLTGSLPGEDGIPASKICGCSRLLDGIIFRATHPDPVYRYESADAMAAELGKVANATSRHMLIAPSVAARPAVAASTALPGARPSALRPPAPRSVAGAKPPSAHGRPAPAIQVKGGNTGSIMLVVLLIVAVVITVIVLKRPKPVPPPATAPPEVAVVPPVAVEEKPVPAFADPQATLRSARSAASQRAAPFLETYKRDLKAIEDAGEPAKMKALEEKLAAAMKSQAGIYVMDLENRVALLKRAGDLGAIEALEEEIRRVSGDPGYFPAMIRR